MAWFQVFFLDDVIRIGSSYELKQAIPRMNGYFDRTVPMYSDSQTFQNESRDSRSPNKNDWKLQVPSS